MLCNNCGKRKANVRYTENINGVKKELNLCEECSQKLGIGQMEFEMPMVFSSLVENLIEDFEIPRFMPTLKVAPSPLNRKNQYKEGIGKIIDKKIDDKIETKKEKVNKTINKEEPKSQIEKLKENLKHAIEQEKYEEAAKIRDKIKKLQK